VTVRLKIMRWATVIEDSCEAMQELSADLLPPDAPFVFSNTILPSCRRSTRLRITLNSWPKPTPPTTSTFGADDCAMRSSLTASDEPESTRYSLATDSRPANFHFRSNVSVLLFDGNWNDFAVTGIVVSFRLEQPDDIRVIINFDNVAVKEIITDDSINLSP